MENLMRSKRPRPRRIHPRAATHPPPPEPAGDIGVLASMNLGNRAQWLRVGVAHVEAGLGNTQILCVRLGAIPLDHLLYIPLGDVLASANAAKKG
jgi:hypothetical protein